MSKIICDVCGTSYPESVSQCPICGCVRSVNSCVIPGKEDDAPQTASGGSYTYVKGGRFSKSNVKKRQKIRTQEQPATTDDNQEYNHDTKKTDRGLLVAFVVLLIAVVAVVLYIIFKFLAPANTDANSSKLPANETTNVTSSVVQTDGSVPCQGIVIAQSSVSLAQIGDTHQISVECAPADTTDTLSFVSGDTTVVTVSDVGLVTAIGVGQTTVTVSCGDVTDIVTFTCAIGIDEPTQNTEPTIDVTIVPDDFKLNREDFTLYKGQSHNVLHKDCSIPADAITWTSSKPSVAKVVNGKVTAVSKGTATITAEYNGVTLTCIARVRVNGD